MGGDAQKGKRAKKRTDMLHVVPQHHLVEDFAALESDQRVVHLRLLAPQRLDVIVFSVEGRRRTRPALCLCRLGLGALRPLRLSELCARHLGAPVGRGGGSGDGGGKASRAPQSVDGLCARVLHCAGGWP